MKEEVLISIIGLHTLSTDDGSEAGDGNDEIEIIYPGKYKKVGETECVRFTEVGEMGKSDSLIKLRDGSFELIKTGDMAAHMLFEVGKKTFTDYLTPFGLIELGICTSKVEITREENKLEAYAQYELEADGNCLSQCQIRLRVVPREDLVL